MVHRNSKVDVPTSNFSVEDNVAAETNLVETELLSNNDPVGMDLVQVEIVSQGENKVEKILGEEEGNCDEEEEEEGNDYDENAIDEEGNDDELTDEEDDGDGYDNNVDVDDIDVEEDDDYFDEDEDDDYFDEDEDDDDEEEEDMEKEDLMEDDVDVEHKESDVYGGEDNKGENKKEENKEKGGGSLETEVKKLVKKNGKKEVVKRDLGKVTFKSEDKLQKDEEKDPMVETDEKKGEGSAEKKVKRLRKRIRRKVTRGNSGKLASGQEDKVESSRRKKTSKKVESMGMIFMCSSKTKKDCYRYKVLGLPASKRYIVGKIYKGMRLFLYDVELKLMYGIYKAAGPGGYNIEPKAFKSQFPSQVRFSVLEDCIPLAEEKFKKVIKENYFTKSKFDCQLKSEQVKKLCKLFVTASKGLRSKGLNRGLKEKNHASVKRDRRRARSIDEDRHSALSKKRRYLDYEERHSTLDEKRRYLDYPDIHRREVIASRLSPLSRNVPLRSPTAPSYAYDRIDAYRQNVMVDHHDSYRLPLLESRDAYRREPYTQAVLESQNAYRREPLLEHHDVHRLDPLLNHRDSYRRAVSREHRDLRPAKLEIRHPDEIAGRDSYIPDRERQSYRNPVYLGYQLPERDRYHDGGLRTEYRYREAALPEYRSTRARYRY